MEKSLLEAIKQAIQDEAIGKNVYLKAYENAKNETVKMFFKKMASEEQMHIKYLEKLYKYFDNSNNLHELLVDVHRNYKPTKEIFTKDFLTEINKNESLILSLNKSATLEKNSINYYKDCEKLATNQETKNFFASMVTWETDHLNKILDLFEQIDDSEISFKQDELL